VKVQSKPFSNLEQPVWDGLCATPGPFVDWRFLASAAEAGCTGPAAGWHPLALIENDADGQPAAGAPAWLKDHSHGEFVFDFAWARAADQIGLPWYPKLLVAAPFTPVTGPRLLGAEQHPQAGQRLIATMQRLVDDHALSSGAVNFCSATDADLLRRAGWLERFDWQYHWHNPGYASFDEFLAGLRRKPRKNIRAERRKAREQGWTFRFRSGHELTGAELDLVDSCYRTTFHLYGNRPSLNRAFFELAARRFGAQFLVCIAARDNTDLACAIFWRDNDRLYGRYWGSLVDTRDVHFEACYYQGISYCIEHGLSWFEPGAQGEHKIRRGFLPRKTRSFHYVRDPRMRAGIADWLQAEAGMLREYRQRLEALNPFGDR